MRYIPKGICASSIDIELNNGIIENVEFTGGCNGNHQGISKLVEGMPAQEAIQKLSGIHCGFRQTSCPDQLAQALKKMLEDNSSL